MKFLKDSDQIITQIYSLIQSTPVSKSGENYFIHNSTKIYLSNDTCNKLYNFILNMDDDKLSKSLNKSVKNYFSFLHFDIHNNFDFISKDKEYFKYIDKKIFTKVVLKILSYELQHSYKIHRDIKIQISSISRNLGRME